jgi:two-component system nitrate/nitrite sensor histidine kinase NarX
VLDRFGLVEGLKELAEDLASLGNWNLELDLPPADSYMEGELTNAIYGVAREALLNALKHSEASSVRVLLQFQSDHYLLEVKDNGVGLPENMSPEASNGLGLAAMRDRIQTLGGSMNIDRLKSGGTRISAFFPFKPQEFQEVLS